MCKLSLALKASLLYRPAAQALASVLCCCHNQELKVCSYSPCSFARLCVHRADKNAISQVNKAQPLNPPFPQISAGKLGLGLERTQSKMQLLSAWPLCCTALGTRLIQGYWQGVWLKANRLLSKLQDRCGQVSELPVKPGALGNLFLGLFCPKM